MFSRRILGMMSSGIRGNHVPLVSSEAKVSIPMTIWIALTNLMRLNYLHRIRTLANCLVALVHRTMADYHDIYLQLEVLLLADVFEKFCTTCLEYYSFNPVHYYTTSGLAWDAVLRMSRVDLQLITDVDMYHFVENSIQGGISMTSTCHAQANSPSFPDTYDSSLPNQNHIYLDANNLYSWAGQCLNLCPLMDFVFSSRMRFLR